MLVMSSEKGLVWLKFAIEMTSPAPERMYAPEMVRSVHVAGTWALVSVMTDEMFELRVTDVCAKTAVRSRETRARIASERPQLRGVQRVCTV
jgi:hypothetical protein